MNPKELIVDSFAGGGGASLGIHMAVGRSPDIAINHNASAIVMHAANHPETKHFTEDVWKINPRKVTKGRKVGLLWASPDCRHFSRAKGATPVKKNIRSLAWVVCRWAMECKPRVIILENVREFEEWGPLVPRWECAACGWYGSEGQVLMPSLTRKNCPRCSSRRVRETLDQMPCPYRKGLTFKRFIGRLKKLGYAVEWRTLNAADYGAPTHRRRLFLVARRDGEPIVWPEPTHGDPKKLGDEPLFGDERKPWRTAAECIDWSIACPSIFDRKKPLAPATMKRIAMGIKRYVLDNPKPFIVQLAHGGGGTFDDGRSKDVEEPLGTVHAGGGNHALVSPYVTPLTHTQSDRRGSAMDEPLPTVTGAHRGEQALIAPILVGAGGSVYAAKPKPLDAPRTTILANDRAALVSAFIIKHFGGNVGCKVDQPLPTTTARGTQNQLLAANLIRMNHGEKQWNAVDEPHVTVTSANHSGLVAANLLRFNFDDAGLDIKKPLPTVTSNNHAALVYSFLVKYFGTAIGVEVDVPLPTATGKDRFGLVTVDIDGEPYVIVDIGMRMLTPRELARAQGFPDDYKLVGTKTVQVHKIGNSVSPPVARALVAANCGAEVLV